MHGSPQKTINLAALGDGMPGLSSHCGQMLAEAATVCLENREHPPGIGMSLTGMQAAEYLLDWSTGNDQLRRTYNDLQEATERGASAIAILLLQDLTGMVVVERSKKGSTFDYWLGDDDEELFTGKARLEVSGILMAGSNAQFKARVKQKKEQIKPSDHLARGYVAIVEFGNPTAHVEMT